MKFFQLKSLPIGLDLGRNAVRAVQLLRRGPRPDVQAAFATAVEEPAAAAEESVRARPQTGADAKLDMSAVLTPDDPKSEQKTEGRGDYEHYIDPLQKLIRRGGFNGNDVVIHCPADRLYMRRVDLPAPPTGLPRPAVIGAMKMQLADHLTVPVEQAVFDFHPLHHDLENGKLQIMAFVTDQQWIVSRMKLLAEVGLNCMAIDALPCALARLWSHSLSNQPVEPTSENDEAPPADAPPGLVGILDMGHTGSTLVVAGPDGPLLSRRFECGGRELTETISMRLQIDPNRAESIKCKYGFDIQTRRLRTAQEKTAGTATLATPAVDDGMEIAKTLFAAVQNELNSLIEGVVRTLNYAITEYKQYRLEALYLCGAAGHTANLDAYLADILELPVMTLSHPLLADIVNWLPATRRNPGAWSTALGLALPGDINR